ncbi:MAG: NifB/NifX family molybdenum-iron cluster-binding protein [Bacteroidales bacterium]
MEKRIAVPLENDLLCTHFGHCQSFAIVSTVDGLISGIKVENPPEHTPGAYPRWIAGLGVSVVIAGGIGQKAIALLNEQNIDVFIGAPVKSAKDLVADFLADKLSLNANYCDRHEHHHGDHSSGNKHHHGSCRH